MHEVNEIRDISGPGSTAELSLNTTQPSTDGEPFEEINKVMKIRKCT